MQHLDNPAGRLHNLLDGLRRTNHGIQLYLDWAAVFQISQHDSAELLRRLARTMALPGEAKEALERVDPAYVNHEMLLRWFPRVNQLFTSVLTLQSPLNTVVSLLDEATMFSLEACSDSLHRLSPEPTVSETDLAELGNLLKELRDAIDSALS